MTIENHSTRVTGPLWTALLCALLLHGSSLGAELRLDRDEYRDRTQAIWAGQIIGMYLAYPFEHRMGSVAWFDDFHKPTTWELEQTECARVDDDWYYEIVALRGFEQYGVDAGRAWFLTVWVDNRQVFERLIQGNRGGKHWEPIRIDLSEFAGREVQLRVCQLVLGRNIISPGSAYWHDLMLTSAGARTN